MRRKCRLFDSSWVFFHVCLKTSYFYPKTPLLHMQQRSVLKKWTTICIEVMTCLLLHCDKNVTNIYIENIMKLCLWRHHENTCTIATLWPMTSLWQQCDDNVTHIFDDNIDVSWRHNSKYRDVTSPRETVGTSRIVWDVDPPLFRTWSFQPLSSVWPTPQTHRWDTAKHLRRHS